MVFQQRHFTKHLFRFLSLSNGSMLSTNGTAEGT